MPDSSPSPVILLTVPGLRKRDLAAMPRLRSLAAGGESAPITPSFPAVTCPVQANMTTGRLPAEHGVVANGFFWREKREVEMWTAWNDCIQRPQIWDLLHEHDPGIRSAVWFPMHSKGCGADYVCTPAPIHNPDGSESLWCYTKPEPLYGELRDALGHFPLQHFWGPIAGIQSSAWIVQSAVEAARRWQPEFFYIYLPHLDYAAQKHGPDSDAAAKALGALDAELGKLFDGLHAAYDGVQPLWIAASEYTIVPVDRVVYPNRLLREMGLLALDRRDDGEHLNCGESPAWALVDHQFAHVFVRDADRETVERVAARFRQEEGVAEVLTGEGLQKYHLDHPRSGEVVLVAEPDTWFAYYWWTDDGDAPAFARTVDIHRKPGYDPVELHFDVATKGIPLDAALVRGSHGAPATAAAQKGIALASEAGVLGGAELADTDIAGVVLRRFGMRK